MPQELTDEGTSRFVNTKSWKLHYNEAGDGHPVVLLHGSGAGASGWSNFRPNIPALAEDFRVLALDAPGWGRSDAALPQDYDHPNAVLELLDALDIEKAALVGNSMGGMTAVTFAARYPDRISHLVTMGPGAFITTPTLFGFGDGPTEGLKILFEGYRDPSPATMKRLVEVMTFDSANATDELAAERAANAQARPDHLANFLEGMAGGGPVRTAATVEQAAGIRTPTLLVHGRDDRVVHYEQRCGWSRRSPTPGSSCSTAADTGHSSSTPRSSTGSLRSSSGARRDFRYDCSAHDSGRHCRGATARGSAHRPGLRPGP